jgi:hypothetical protein
MEIVVRGIETGLYFITKGHQIDPYVPWCKYKEIQPAYITCSAENDLLRAGNVILTSLRLFCISLGVSRTEFPVTRERSDCQCNNYKNQYNFCLFHLFQC